MIKYMKNSVYRGVTPSVRCASKPWRAQIAADGKNYHLGNFEDEEGAARAYDNAAYHLRDLRTAQPVTLNFPQEYVENRQPMADSTRRVVLGCLERRQGRPPQSRPRCLDRLLPIVRQLSALLPELESASAETATVGMAPVNAGEQPNQ